MSVFRDIGEYLLPALWRASWQGGLVIVALWCLCRALLKCRWFSADLRCWLWRAAYVKLLVGLAISGSVVLPVLPAANTSVPSMAAIRQTMPAPTVIPPAAAAGVPASLPPAAPPDLTWQTAVAVFYLTGVGVCLSRIVLAGVRTRQLLQNASPFENEDTTEIKGLAAQLGLRRVPPPRTSASITVPVYAAGTVLLPADATYTSEERRLILAHELAHARRRDLVWEWLGTLTQAVFFFHPLVLLARREERLARESATDALTLRVTEAPASHYGKLLLSISRCDFREAMPFVGALGVLDRGSLLRYRLLALKEFPIMPVSFTRRVLVSVFFLTVALGSLVPWQITQAAQSDAKSASEGKLTVEILSEGRRIVLYYPLKEKAQANQIRILADRVIETPEGYRCTGKVVVTSSRDQKPVFTVKTNSLLVGKQGETSLAPAPASDNQSAGSRKVSIRANGITSTPQGNLCEGDVTITTYQGERIVSRIKASRAFIKTKNPVLPQSKPSGMEIELDHGGVLEIRAYNVHSDINIKRPEAGKGK